MALKGDAAFTYDRGAGTVVVLLEIPLFRVTAAETRRRFEVWSVDGTAKEVLTVGAGVPEIRGTIRLHDDAQELLDLLKAGADGYELTYYPSYNGGLGTGYPCYMVEPSGDTLSAALDSSDLGVTGRVEVSVRLRRTDGGTFDALFS